MLIFAGDKIQADNYNQKLAQVGAAPSCARKRPVPNPAARRSTRSMSAHPALQIFADPILARIASSRARVWGYTRAARAASRSSLWPTATRCCSNKESAREKSILMTTTADRDWSDLPVKDRVSAVDPVADAVSRRRQARPIGRGHRRRQPSKSCPCRRASSARACASPSRTSKMPKCHRRGKRPRLGHYQDNDRAGIYRLSLPAGAEKESARRKSTPSTRRFSNRAWMRSATVNCRPS